MTGLRAHGGRIDLAASLYPEAPVPWLDLSTGINPRAWASDPMPTVDLTVLPSPASIAALENAAGAVFGIDADRVVALPGSEIGLRMLSCLDLPHPLQVVVPSYATHRDVFAAPIPIVRAVIDAVDAGTLLLANPNNPDGLLDPPARLLAIARRGAWVIVDEAFVDLLPSYSVVPHLETSDRVIVFRSFGKTFGLPGVRLGFMIGPPLQIAMLRARLGAWPISAHATAYGTAAYRDTTWLNATRAAIVDRAARLDAVLARHDLDTIGDCPSFRLIETDDAPALFERMARAGILTRAFDHDPRWLRLGVPGDDMAFERLDRALGRD
ncbi:aminotransferase class I/II-fold pyridoxal phosphate-dependent enzyme [Sphingomonas sp. Leaf38]|uniref:aminotransferase class I/II-fold pyridoxal phosphate-dependent enzyme n=1 Tax=Sphingomonas sp. Leaf38 TaxID=1736217 RepID=UPI0006FDBB7F|nr:aminotransferase class I/II-fold pyridoxal phosphate-dependent enzyme [Sphingomonas sp. Leaf38]KQN32879.1 threonine-phosphate decarboxylase [Sphingomonas sp. Leaf38]